MDNLKFIEYACCQNINDIKPNIILIDVKDIKSFMMTSNRNIVILKTSSECFNLIGTYRTITNRFYYALNKKINSQEDDTIRPSIRVLHKPHLLETDISYIDEAQLKAFIEAFSDINDEKLKNISHLLSY